MTLLHQAVLDNNIPEVTRLIESGVPLNALKGDETALAYAVSSGNEQMVQLLIGSGADVDAGGSKPLALAVMKGYQRIVSQLIDAGAEVNADEGKALYQAVSYGSLAMITQLITAGAALNIEKKRYIPLTVAVVRKRHDVVQLLLDAQADPDGGYCNPLHQAVSLGDQVSVKQLIAAGAALDLEQNEESPLSIAAGFGDMEIVQLLIAAGADVINDGKHRALSAALKRDHVSIVALLRQAIKDQEERELSEHVQRMEISQSNPIVYDEMKEFFNRALPQQVSIRTPTYRYVPGDLPHDQVDGPLNPALKIYGDPNTTNKMEQGRWEIFVLLENEKHQIGLRSGIKSKTADCGDLNTVGQFNFTGFFPKAMDTVKEYLKFRCGHPSLALDFRALDRGVFKTLPVYIGGWMIRNDLSSQKRIQVYWSSGRYSRPRLSTEQMRLLQLCTAFYLMLEYGEDFKVEFYKHGSIARSKSITRFIDMKASGGVAYDWRRVVKEIQDKLNQERTVQSKPNTTV